MLPRAVERDQQQTSLAVSSQFRCVEVGDVDGRRGGGGGKQVEGGGRGRSVEEGGEAGAEAAAGDGGGAEEGSGEDGSCGELVVRLVRVMKDEDLG